MITPRLFRRSLRRGLQPRLLFLWWASLLLPGALAALPVFAWLRSQLDHWTDARRVVAWMDGATLLDLLRHLHDAGADGSIRAGFAGGALALLFIAPFTAGAMVAAARADEPLSLRRLLAGAGELYGRMLRTQLWGLLPLGAGGGLAALFFWLAGKANDRAVLEAQADAHLRAAAVAAAVALFLAHLLVDAARAQFAAGPPRASALFALWAAAKLAVRRPLRVLGVGALGTAVGLGGAAFLMLLRLRVDQGVAWRIALAWALAQGAQLAIGWGRAARIFGLADLARAHAASRARPLPAGPPGDQPPASPVDPATLSALSSPPLSRTDASGT